MAAPLAEQACRTLAKGTPPLVGPEVERLLAQLDPAWGIRAGPRLVRRFAGEYPVLLELAQRIGALAQEHDHHPDLELGYGLLEVAWTTHSVGGLSLNDFVLAAKIDRITVGTSF